MILPQMKTAWRGIMIGAAIGMLIALIFLGAVLFLPADAEKGENLALLLYAIVILGFPANAMLLPLEPPSDTGFYWTWAGLFSLIMVFQLAIVGFLIDSVVRWMLRKKLV